MSSVTLDPEVLSSSAALALGEFVKISTDRMQKVNWSTL